MLGFNEQVQQSTTKITCQFLGSKTLQQYRLDLPEADNDIHDSVNFISIVLPQEVLVIHQ